MLKKSIVILSLIVIVMLSVVLREPHRMQAYNIDMPAIDAVRSILSAQAILNEISKDHRYAQSLKELADAELLVHNLEQKLLEQNVQIVLITTKNAQHFQVYTVPIGPKLGRRYLYADETNIVRFEKRNVAHANSPKL